MATIVDVAAKAGVSRQTVSRVINNRGYVDAETRARVQKAIEELKYRPNMLAKAFATRRSQTVAHVMTNISDSFHNLVNQGFESVALHRGYTSMMCDAHSSSRERDYIDMFIDHRIGGVVFHHLAIGPQQIQELMRAGVQCVLLDNETDVPGVSSVQTDNYFGGCLAAEHLLSRGHRRIAVVHGACSPEQRLKESTFYEDTFQYRIWRQRTAGFEDTLQKNGLEPLIRFQSHGRTDLASVCSEEIVNTFLSMEQRPTAIYCEDDTMAASIIVKFQEHGIRMPEDCAVMGYDGLDFCRIIHPYITTIMQPRYEMGCLAANMLIDRIEGIGEVETKILQPELMIGETT